MRQDLIQIFNYMGLEIVAQDQKDDYSTTGYIVVKKDESFFKITFTEDSYSMGAFDNIRRVTPRPVEKVEYV